MRNENSLSEGGKSSRNRFYTLAVVCIALFCAVLLWLYVLGYESPNYEKKFSQIPIDIIGVTELNTKMQYTVVSDLDFSFDVTVTGKKTDVNKLRSSDISAYIDVSGVVTPGNSYLPVTVVAPNGISVSAQSSAGAYIYIDKMVTVEVPVRISITDYQMSGELSLGAPQLTPATVTVTGPESELKQIEEAYASIKPGTVSSSFTSNTTINIYKAGGLEVTNPYVTVKDTSVSVFVPVYKTKTLPVNIYFVGGVFGKDNAIITLSDSHITVRGASSVVDTLDEIAVNIDETTIRSHSVVTKNIILPDGVDNLSGKDTITVEIALNSIGTRTVAIKQDTFEIINPPEGLDVSVFTQALNITVMGPIDALRYMDSSYFKVLVDLSGMNLEQGMNINVPADIFFHREISGIYVFGDYAVNIGIN